jgi:hypothetical protein
VYAGDHAARKGLPAPKAAHIGENARMVPSFL